MRYVTVRITPTEGEAFHPIGQALADEPAVTRGPIHRYELLSDGSAIMLGEGFGDRERYGAVLDGSPYVHDYSVTGTDGWWYSYTHFEPTDLTRSMLEHRRESEVMMEMPLEVAEDGSFEITFVGDQAAFADAVLTDRDGIAIEVLETGDHTPEADDLFGVLTARQQEVLEAAVRLGYYRNPRETTHEAIAERVDASPSTVGEHLRKIESRVFSRFVRPGASDDPRPTP